MNTESSHKLTDEQEAPEVQGLRTSGEAAENGTQNQPKKLLCKECRGCGYCFAQDDNELR